jgi:hypothetical protein
MESTMKGVKTKPTNMRQIERSTINKPPSRLDLTLRRTTEIGTNCWKRTAAAHGDESLFGRNGMANW